jgi:cytoskeletal protein CcmA (bactofilin family)
MNMFGTNTPKSNTTTSAVDTLIGRQTEVLGDVHFSGGLHIDGKVKGKVIARSDKAASLSVSETGCVEGDVRVPNIVLNGAVSGDVHASEKITLAAKARVTGNVFYKIIEMEGGALVNGQMVHEPSGGLATAAGPTGTGGPSVDELREARRVKGLGP